MAPSVRISRKAAGRILADFDSQPFTSGGMKPFIEELRRALEPRPKSSQAKRTEKKRRAKSASTKEIRAAVMERAGGKCEFLCGNAASELHHAFGRRKVRQAERNCIALCRDCHWRLTNNVGGASPWWQNVAGVFARHGFDEEKHMAMARMEFVTIRGALPWGTP